MRTDLMGLIYLVLTGCPQPTPTGDTFPYAHTDACEACLDEGGTWQPEVGECTADCALLDISCYTDTCPGDCGPASCGQCFDPDTCGAAGCTWQQEGPTLWCSGA